LITVDESIAADQEAQEIVDAALRPFQYLREVVGRTDVALNRNTVLEATMDNFLLNALMRQTQAQVAFSNGWRYGAPIPAGDVTLNDLYNITPMNPPIATVNLTGEEIQTMLEENLEHTFSRSPYQQMGGYLKRIMGLTIYVKIENPHGQRIQQIFVQDRPLELKRTYPAVFVTEQGVSPRFGTDRQQHDIHAVDAMRDLLRYSTTGWQISGRVVAV
jgi:2',3'-cyclic-nucleotide 2'-phosphodiesterase (5'-nucleotidase family)